MLAPLAFGIGGTLVAMVGMNIGALTASVAVVNKHAMINCRHKHAKAKKSPNKGTEDFRTL
jgi:hypothetical protein